MKNIYGKSFAIYVLCCLFTIGQVPAQNLVPNPSFEGFNSCPATLDGIVYDPSYTSFPFVQDWVNPMLQTTSDYYNSCAKPYPATFVSVPKNRFGTIPAHSGNAYAGLIPYEQSPLNSGTHDDYREYIECKLKHSLSAGHTYTLSFFVRYAFPIFYYSNFVAVDRIGMYFSDTMVYSSYLSNLSLNAQFKNAAGNYITDTSSWVNISGAYTAHGGEQWLSIGFFNDSLPVNDTLLYPASIDSTSYKWSYVFIDDVSVIDSSHCDTSYSRYDSAICKMAPFDVTLTASNSGAIYKWSTGDTTISVSVHDEGVYWCMVINGCGLHIDSFYVRSYKMKVTNLHDSTICKDGTVILNAIDSANTYLWDNGNKTREDTVTGMGIYYCSSVKGCILYKDSFYLNETVSNMYLNLGDDTTICKEDKFVLDGAVNTATKYSWNTGDTKCCISPDKTGEYILTVSDGCNEVSDSIHIIVTGCVGCILMPSAFSPNNDGNNDRFGPVVKCPVKGYHFFVFDRWGEKIFESEDINYKWDGIYKGKPMEVGTYYYYLYYWPLADSVGHMVELKGDVTLIR
jgi:gliding motility-associated-like protein